MDLTGSIAEATVPFSIETFGSFDGVGSSAVDTILGFVLELPLTILGLVAGIGGDLGSTLGSPLG